MSSDDNLEAKRHYRAIKNRRLTEASRLFESAASHGLKEGQMILISYCCVGFDVESQDGLIEALAEYSAEVKGQDGNDALMIVGCPDDEPFPFDEGQVMSWIEYISELSEDYGFYLQYFVLTDVGASKRWSSSSFVEQVEAERTDASLYLSDAAHAANLKMQTQMTPMTVARILGQGLTEGTPLSLGYVFHLSSILSAGTLRQALTDLGYKCKDPQEKSLGAVTISGQTTEMSFSEQHILDWTREMCHLGFQHDAKFDGWGATWS